MSALRAALVLLVLTGCRAEEPGSAGDAAVLGANRGRPGMHDHTPHHGGVVAMIGMLHLEAVANAAGAVRVYLTDVWRRPLPLTNVRGSVTLNLPDGRRTIPLAPRDGVLGANGPPLAGRDVVAHVQLLVEDAPVEMHFVLPLTPGASGAAEVPLDGCIAVPGDGATRRPRCTLDFARPITFVAAVPGGDLALVAVVNGGVGGWRMPAGRFAVGFAAAPAVPLPGAEAPHPEAANAVAVGPDGRETVVAIENRLLVYDTASGALRRELPRLRGVVRSVTWSADASHLLVTVFYDAAAHLVTATDGREERVIPVEREGAGVAVSADGRLAAAGSELGPITLVDLAGDGAARRLDDSQRAIEALAFAGDRLVSAGGDGIVRMWDVRAGTVTARAEIGGALYRLAIAPGGRLVASAGLDHAIRLHDVTNGALVETLAWHEAAVWGLAWVGPLLVSGDGDGHVAVWDLADRLRPPA